MTNSARRPIPHINHTVALAQAATAVTNAKDGAGTILHLCANPMDVHQVRDSLQGVADLFEDPSFFFEGESPTSAELTAVNSLILLATLLREHLLAGNTI